MPNKTTESDQSDTDNSPKSVKASRGKKSSKSKQGSRNSPEEKDVNNEVKDTNLNDSRMTDDESPDDDANKTNVKKSKENDTTDEQRSQKPQKPLSSNKSWSTQKKLFTGSIVFLVGYFIITSIIGNSNSDSPSNDIDWRLKVDPNNTLSNHQRSIVRASLKPILDKSSTNQDEGVSTLLILSSNEETAAKLAQCLLRLVNKQTKKDDKSTEIDLQSHDGGKLTLDTKLRTLLNTTDAIRAVLLRRIGDIPAKDALSQLNLLFAYCDGENPVIPHRLIIMTATTSNSKNENELRENFKTRWPQEHDFVDALMSRISGHTLYVDQDQKSIC